MTMEESGCVGGEAVGCGVGSSCGYTRSRSITIGVDVALRSRYQSTRGRTGFDGVRMYEKLHRAVEICPPSSNKIKRER